jgi:Putative beta barrel porin-7 (BBP7)
MWFDECQTRGIQGNFFFLGDDSDGLTAGGNGLPVVSRPFTNGNTGLQDVELVSFPNVLSGTVTARANTSVIGGGPSFVRNLCCGPCGRLDLLLGYTYLGIEDEVTIRENLTSLPGQTNVAPGTRFLIEDRFRTTNDFHGALVGVQGERRFSNCYVGYNASIAFGVNRQVTTISGSTTIIPPDGTPTTLPGGLLTQRSNIGRYSRDEFAVLPQFGLRLGCQLTERLRAYVGYDVAYLSNVARAGDQIDLRVNPTQIPSLGSPAVTGPAVPAFPNRQTDFFMHGVRVGVELRF